MANEVWRQKNVHGFTRFEFLQIKLFLPYVVKKLQLN